MTSFQWLLNVLNGAPTDDCVDWPFATHRGYGVLCRERRSIRAHRYSCEAIHGPAPSEKHEAAHSCGRSICVNPRHLRWATHAENQGDRIEHGTHNRGERYGASKLTEARVRHIRAAVAAGQRQCDLATFYRVSRVTISDVVNRRSWAWLDAEVAA